MAIEWTADLAVGHDEIDRQHQELFRRFGELLEACRQSQGKARVGELLTFLASYVEEHFRAEEALMRRHGYPEAEEHFALHQGFRQQLNDLQEEFSRDGATTGLVITTNQVVLRWLLDHIQRVDTRLGRFLAASP